MKNEMKIQFSALSQNESFARVTVAAFIAQLDPTVDELTEIKTVVSEAVTNAIIHGYENSSDGIVYIEVLLDEDTVKLTIRDKGVGISDLNEARRTSLHFKAGARKVRDGLYDYGEFYG